MKLILENLIFIAQSLTEIFIGQSSQTPANKPNRMTQNPELQAKTLINYLHVTSNPEHPSSHTC